MVIIFQFGCRFQFWVAFSLGIALDLVDMPLGCLLHFGFRPENVPTKVLFLGGKFFVCSFYTAPMLLATKIPTSNRDCNADSNEFI